MIKELLTVTSCLTDTEATNLADRMIERGDLTEVSSVDEFMDMRREILDKTNVENTRQTLIDELDNSSHVRVAVREIGDIVNNLISADGGAHEYYGIEFGVRFFLLGEGEDYIESESFANCDWDKRREMQEADDAVSTKVPDRPVTTLPRLLTKMLMSKGVSAKNIPTPNSENTEKLIKMVRCYYKDDISILEKHDRLNKESQSRSHYFSELYRLVHSVEVVE